MSFTSPKLTITNKDDTWTITTSTTIRTLTVNFKLGEEYEESMPQGALKVCQSEKNYVKYKDLIFRARRQWKMRKHLKLSLLGLRIQR